MLSTLQPTNPSLIPLSEDEPLFLSANRELIAGTDEQDRVELGAWDQVTALGRGEKRNISLSVRLRHDVVARMIRVFEVPEGARLTIEHSIEVEAGAKWNGTFLIRGAGEVRLRRALQVFGPGTHVELNVLANLHQKGRMSAAEEIFCNQQRCEVNIRTRFLLNDAAQATARARLVIGEQAVETTGSEELHALALGDHTQVQMIPELEVKQETAHCHHAASCLPADGYSTFYLGTRGLAEKEVRAVLSRGFAQPILERLPEEMRQQGEDFLFG